MEYLRTSQPEQILQSSLIVSIFFWYICSKEGCISYNVADGFITNIPAYKLVSSCPIDSTWYPFDDQTCDIKMGSWVYNGFKVNLKLQSSEAADISSYISNPEWDLLGAPAERHEIIYECCPEPYIGEYYMSNEQHCKKSCVTPKT